MQQQLHVNGLLRTQSLTGQRCQSVTVWGSLTRQRQHSWVCRRWQSERCTWMSHDTKDLVKMFAMFCAAGENGISWVVWAAKWITSPEDRNDYNANYGSDVPGTLAIQRVWFFPWHATVTIHFPKEKWEYLSLDAESSSVIHDALAHPCNGLGCTIWCVAQDG